MMAASTYSHIISIILEMANLVRWLALLFTHDVVDVYTSIVA